MSDSLKPCVLQSYLFSSAYSGFVMQPGPISGGLIIASVDQFLNTIALQSLKKTIEMFNSDDTS